MATCALNQIRDKVGKLSTDPVSGKLNMAGAEASYRMWRAEEERGGAHQHHSRAPQGQRERSAVVAHNGVATKAVAVP